MLFWLMLLTVDVSAQSLGIKVCETGASPAACGTGIKEIYVTPGSLTISGQIATLAIGGGGGGTGDVVGPGSSTDNAVVRFDLATGKLIQNSVVLIGDTGNITGVGTLNTHTIPGGTDTFAMLGVANAFTGANTWSPSANTTPITVSNYSLTGSNASSMVNWSGTINTTGSPDIFKFSVVDTARGANTKLFNFYGGAAGTTSLFALNNTGTELAFNASGVVIRNNGASGLGLRGGSTVVNLLNTSLTLGTGGAAGDFTIVGGIRLADANAYDVILSAADAWNSSTNRNGGNLRLVPGAPSGSGSRGKVIFGLTDSATPLAVTLGFSGATGSNVAGVNTTIIASQSTGNANGGSMIFQTTPPGSSGSSQNTPVTAFTIAPDGVIYPKTYTHANLPTPINGDGGMVFCSDCTIASPCASGGSGAMAKRLNGAWVCN